MTGMDINGDAASKIGGQEDELSPKGSIAGPLEADQNANARTDAFRFS